MIFKWRGRQNRRKYPEIFQAQKKRELSRGKISKEEWDAFEKIAAYCRDDSRTIALDLLTLGKKNHIIALNLSGQALKSLPSAIQHLSYLRQLLLIENQLTSLPPEIQSLKQLEILYIDRNPLGVLPRELLNLKTLQQLSLGETSMAEIPTWIDQLEQLTHLWLNNNALASLPRTLSKLTKLQRLDLRENPKLKPDIDRNWTGKALIEFLGVLSLRRREPMLP